MHKVCHDFHPCHSLIINSKHRGILFSFCKDSARCVQSKRLRERFVFCLARQHLSFTKGTHGHLLAASSLLLVLCPLIFVFSKHPFGVYSGIQSYVYGNTQLCLREYKVVCTRKHT